MYFPYTFICIKICRNTVILDGAFVLGAFDHILKSYFSFSCIYKSRSFYTRFAFYIYCRIFGIRKMRYRVVKLYKFCIFTRLQPIKERTQTKAKTDPIKFFIQSHSFAKFKFDNSFIIHIDEKTERSSKL